MKAASIPDSELVGEHVLENGRKYRLLDHGEYKAGEYPTGGIHICAWEPLSNEGQGGWVYIDNAPDRECARNFLKAAERMIPLWERSEALRP